MSRSRAHRRDEGSTLILILVLIVLSSMVMVPLLKYSMSVIRAGDVQSDKARSTELARGGLRTALTSTRALYEQCGNSIYDPPRALANPSLSGVQSTCQVVDTENYRDPATTPYQSAVVQVGQQLPAQFSVNGLSYANPNSADAEGAWWPATSTAALQSTVWTPSLPVRPTSNRTPGTGSPTSYGRLMSYGSCSVYFPGTYTRPIEIDGTRPTYFVSGIYYFESTITFRSGARAVIGDGATEGCASDLEALAYVVNPPETKHISGVGGTFVFGKDGRMILDNTNGTVDVTFNQRYVDASENGALPSQGVSIITVDGDIDDVPNVVSDLFVEDVLATKMSTVVDDDTTVPVDVTRDGYVPSIHTPEPLAPAQPTGLSIQPRRTGPSCGSDSTANPCLRGAATLSWTAPADNGFVITAYVVKDTTSDSVVDCPIAAPVAPETAVQTSCTIVGLRHDVARTFSVTAVNAGGNSVASSAVSVTPDAIGNNANQMSQLLAVPATLTYSGNPTNVPAPVQHSNGVLVTWTAPSNDGGAPITGYTVMATPVINPTVNPVVTCTAWWNATRCLLATDDPSTPAIDGLIASPVLPATLLEQYRITVVATNALAGAPTVSGASLPGVGRTLDYRPAADATVYTPPAPRPPDSIRVPDAIIDIKAPHATNKVSLSVAGYVALGQGRIKLDANAASVATLHDIELLGGVLAARTDLTNTPIDMRLELLNPTTQKTIRLVTTVTGDHRSTGVAIVQINDNFGWGLNSWVVQ